MAAPDVIDRILRVAAAHPDRPAVSWQGTTLSFGALEDRLRRYAGAYRQQAASSVMIALPQGAEAYAALLGAGLACACYAPLNVSAPVDKMLRIVAVLRPDIIVAEAALAALLAPAAPLALRLTPAELRSEPLTGRGSRHPTAYIIFTSGTTGTPKGVMIPRTALDHFIDWVTLSNTVTADDRVAQFSNIAFDVSVTDIYGALSVGACLFPVLGRADRMFPARLVARERLTVWNSVPSVLSLMLQAGEITAALLGSLRLINTCGEPLLPGHVAAVFAALPDTVLQNSYGPTETTVTMTEIRLTAENLQAASGTSMAIGVPIAGMTIDLLGGPDPDEGEIVITGPQLAAGYWDDPQKTAAAFRSIDRGGRPTVAYFSGDWAVRRGGHVFFKERIDRQVKLRGFRLELDEVARAIHDAGFPVTCVLKWRDELAAVIERRAERVFVAAELRTALAKTLEAHAIPSIMRVIDHMPRSQNDKLDREAVAEWLERQNNGPGMGQ